MAVGYTSRIIYINIAGIPLGGIVYNNIGNIFGTGSKDVNRARIYYYCYAGEDLAPIEFFFSNVFITLARVTRRVQYSATQYYILILFKTPFLSLVRTHSIFLSLSLSLSLPGNIYSCYVPGNRNIDTAAGTAAIAITITIILFTLGVEE